MKQEPVPVSLLKFLPITYWIVLPLQIAVGIAVFFIVCRRMEKYNELMAMAMPAVRKMGRKK